MGRRNRGLQRRRKEGWRCFSSCGVGWNRRRLCGGGCTWAGRERELLVIEYGVDQRTLRIPSIARDRAHAGVSRPAVNSKGIARRACIEDEKGSVIGAGCRFGLVHQGASNTPSPTRAKNQQLLQLGAMTR